jgi:hypothetical protein
VEEQTLTSKDVEQRMKSIFGTFAESMNKIELWTGEGPPNPNVSISWANKLRLSVCA